MQFRTGLGMILVVAMAATAGGQRMGMGPQGHGMGPGGPPGAFAPLPQEAASASNPLTEEKIQLGRRLFFDPRLSRAGDVSCNSCHDLSNYGVDGKPVSTGHAGQQGTRNSPTVYNSALHVAQFWDGRAPDVEEQAKGPVMNPVEMAMDSSAAVERRMRSTRFYREAFQAAFPGENEPVTFDNMARAIGAFERVLLTPSPWDRFLKGDRTVLTAEQHQGLMAFRHAGCAACHSGVGVGGGSFQRLGVAKAWPKTEDPGRFAVTGREQDRMVFKVPSLRNAEKTAPYFHDGSVATLEEAIRKMAEYQLNRPLSDRDVRNISSWLQALTGELPARRITPPQLPPLED